MPNHLLRSLSLILVAALGSGAMQITGSNIAAAAAKSSTVTEPCRATQLDARLMGALATYGTTAYVVNFRNISTTACTLRGYPKLQMLNADGGVISTQTLHRSIFDFYATVVKLVTVLPNWSAVFDVSYPDWLRYAPASCPTSNRVKILFSNANRSITVKWRFRPYGGSSIAKVHCGEISVSPFYGPYRFARGRPVTG